MTTLAAGYRLGTYEIRTAIGAGGMGEVYRAHDRVADPDGSVPSITVVQNWFTEFANKR